MSGFDQSPAFTKILEENKGIFYKVALAYCPQEEDRQDLIQEMIIQVWKSFPKYKQESKVSTWIYRIALNVAISWYRKSVVRNKHLVPYKGQELTFSDQEYALETEQNIQALYRFINELKELERAIMLLYLEEKSYREISDILGITETNVATRIGRIKLKIKERFKIQNA